MREAAAGGATYALPLALSDTPGAWRIVAREVATGVEGEASFAMQRDGAVYASASRIAVSFGLSTSFSSSLPRR